MSEARSHSSILEGLGLDPAPVVFGKLELWPSESQAFVQGTRVPLTKQQFDVLAVLVLGANHVISRERIHEQVWGRPLTHQRDRSVDVAVHRIRLKLAEVGPGGLCIHTHHGVGYRLDPGPRHEPGTPEL